MYGHSISILVMLLDALQFRQSYYMHEKGNSTSVADDGNWKMNTTAQMF